MTNPIKGYQTADGGFVPTQEVHLATSAARTATGNGSAVFEVGQRTTLRLALEVTARSGTTPTLDVSVDTSHDGTTWRSHGTFAQVNNTGTSRKSFGGLDRFARVSWTIGGTTPSFTFKVTGEAV